MIFSIATCVLVPAFLPCGVARRWFEARNGGRSVPADRFCVYYKKAKGSVFKDLPEWFGGSFGAIPTTEAMVVQRPFIKPGQGLDLQCNGSLVLPSGLFAVPDDLPAQADLREMGLVTTARDQGSCGACAYFVASQIAESVVLRDFALKYGRNAAFGNSSANLSISTDYLMRNSLSNARCDGANYFVLLDDMARLNMTFETSGHFPYQGRGGDFGAAAAVIREEEKIFPYQIRREVVINVGPEEEEEEIRVNVSCPTNIVPIKLFDQQNTFNARQEALVKLFLAHGIPIQGAMYVDQTVEDSVNFQTYKGGILANTCNKMAVDHSVEFIGYGNFKGTPVWVMRNSWGPSFGYRGVFYVERGKNAYCVEMEAIASLPASETVQSLSEGPFFAPVTNFWRQNVYFSRRGDDGLDLDDGSFNVLPYQGCSVFLIVTLTGITIWLIGTIVVCAQNCNYNRQRRKHGDTEPLLEPDSAQ